MVYFGNKKENRFEKKFYVVRLHCSGDGSPPPESFASTCRLHFHRLHLNAGSIFVTVTFFGMVTIFGSDKKRQWQKLAVYEKVKTGDKIRQ
jgi:hypothetical protein